MRKPLIVLLGLLIVGSVPAMATAPACTIKGTPNRDVLYGTPRSDVICGLAGNDYENGRGSSDIVRGGTGADTLVGGGGQDTLRGKRGNDRLFGVDDRPLDELFGGPGSDTCHVDIGDSFQRCEHVDVSRELLPQRLMMVQFSPALVMWLHEHGEDRN